MFNTIEPEALREQLTAQFAEKILLVEKHYDVTVAEVSHDVIKNVIVFFASQKLQENSLSKTDGIPYKRKKYLKTHSRKDLY